MRFKVIQESTTFKKLRELETKISEVKKQANKLCKKLGGKSIATTGRNAAGGIDAIEFLKNPGKDKWNPVGEKYSNLYAPKAANTEIIKQFSELPVVKFEELNSIVGFTPEYIGINGSMAHVKCIGVMFCEKEILIKSEENSKFKPSKDLIEILESEYIQIAKTVNNV